ncbi:MAG: ABC transporter ATP-binding protein [Deltaproteobacteria bacterium]|nr:MAG: ABC transporter ATP-binding protein [Deltaproteobacteria bacterium]
MPEGRRVADLALRIRGLRRRYGATVALDGLDLDVPRGVICGLVGPNGAGKTTTMGIVAGLIRPDAGTVDVLGEGPFDPTRHAGRVGLLPQDCAMPASLPVGEVLAYYGRLQGLSTSMARRAADRLLDEVDLADRAGQRIGQLSHGMRRRVAVAQALIGDPELVLLDEPTSGLDPHLVVRMRALLRTRRGRCTIVVSSHILAELEATCDHVIFMERGRCTAAGSMAELTGRSRQVIVELEPGLDAPALVPSLQGAGLRAQVDGTRLVVTGPTGEGTAALNARLLPVLLAAGAPIVEVQAGRSLEATWMASRADPPPGPKPG